MKQNQINYLLHQARLNKKEDLKSASKALGISKFNLFLIEHGYWRVAKKQEENFIKHYSLEKDFFKTNSLHVVPIDKNKKETVLDKFFSKLKNPKALIISSICSFLFILTTIGGLVTFNYKYVHPTAFFSNNLTNFVQAVIKDPTAEKSVFTTSYARYTIKKEEIDEDAMHISEMSLATYDDPLYVNSTELNMSVTINNGLQDSYINSYIVSFNHSNICLMGYVQYPKEKEENGILFTNYTVLSYLRNDGSIEIQTMYGGLLSLSKILPGSGEYEKVATDFYISFNQTYPLFDKYFFQSSEHCLVYASAVDMVRDINYVSTQNSIRYKAGVGITIASLILLPISLFFFAFSLVLNLKRKNKIKKERLSFNDKTIEEATIPSRSSGFKEMPNDIRFTPFTPETILKIVSILFVVIYAIALNVSIYTRLNISIFGKQDINDFAKTTSQLLVSGVLLMFFVTIDINHKKTEKQLLTNIFMYFVFGLIYYLIEIFVFTISYYNEDLLTTIIGIFKDIIPGNVVWTLMFFTLVYYFLFVTPNRYENNPKKIRRFRLLSLIPTALLIFALFFKAYLENVFDLSYYITAIFYTKGTILTAFSLLYLYALFFYRYFINKKYGKEQSEVYYNSAKYNFVKNGIACLIIIILFVIDLICYFNLPSRNPLKLGRNWAIILLVPFILFYRNHIGKRDQKLDLTLQGLYILALAGAYIICVFMVLDKLSFIEILRFFK